MKCPVCNKKLLFIKTPYFGFAIDNRHNYRERKRLESERRQQSLKRYTEVFPVYDDVLGVKASPWTAVLMHPQCAEAYHATVKILLSTGELGRIPSKIDRLREMLILNSVCEKSVLNGITLRFPPSRKRSDDAIDAFAWAASSFMGMDCGKVEGTISMTFDKGAFDKIRGTVADTVIIDDAEANISDSTKEMVKEWFEEVISTQSDKTWSTGKEDPIEDIRRAAERIRRS